MVQTPQHRVGSMDELHRTPIGDGGPGNAAAAEQPRRRFSRTTTPLSLNHYNVQPVFDVFANVQGTDLGSVSDAVDQIVAKYRGRSPKPARSPSAGRCRA